MSKYLRHVSTGDVFLTTGALVGRPDMVPITEKEFKAAIKKPKLKPNNASAKKTVAPVAEEKAPVQAALPLEDGVPDPGVDNDTGDVAAALLGGDD